MPVDWRPLRERMIQCAVRLSGGGAEHLPESRIEHAQPRNVGRTRIVRENRGAAWCVCRRCVARVPQRVRERALLRAQEQKHATEL
jgi:hypothetical protein